MRPIVLLITFVVSLSASAARVGTIYGEDNRIDIRDVQDSRVLELARSTAGRVSQWSVSILANPKTSMTVKDVYRLQSSQNLCPGVRFGKQFALPTCTGFLVGEKTLATAGHCVSEIGCDGNAWLFDYHLDTPGQELPTIHTANLYRCQRVITRVVKKGLDYALIELDRPVAGRRPLAFRRSDKLKGGTPLVVIGHPSGLPMKVATGGRVGKVSSKTFSANLDTFGGNSGSPVFNAETLEVEGILSRGQNDYERTTASCRVPVVLKEEKTKETVVRIDKVEELQD